MLYKSLKRYNRKTMSDNNPHICHDGDCDIYHVGICTCGLIHTCLPRDTDSILKIYPKYQEDLNKHESNIALLQDIQRERKL